MTKILLINEKNMAILNGVWDFWWDFLTLYLATRFEDNYSEHISLLGYLNKTQPNNLDHSPWVSKYNLQLVSLSSRFLTDVICKQKVEPDKTAGRLKWRAVIWSRLCVVVSWCSWMMSVDEGHNLTIASETRSITIKITIFHMVVFIPSYMVVLYFYKTIGTVASNRSWTHWDKLPRHTAS